MDFVSTFWKENGPFLVFCFGYFILPMWLVWLWMHSKWKLLDQQIKAKEAAIEACRRKQEELERKWKERLEAGRKETEHER